LSIDENSGKDSGGGGSAENAQGEGQSKNTQRKTMKGQGVLLSDAEDMLPDILAVGVLGAKKDKTTLYIAGGGGVSVTWAVLCWKREERSLKNDDAATMKELYTPRMGKKQAYGNRIRPLFDPPCRIVIHWLKRG
jgi:hypothetical protein